MMTTRPLVMKLSLNVLEHLGLNLYSNVPAVLAEVVANAWDADARHVRIQLDKNCIVIEDDGIGMTRDAVIDRFLFVGYQRRTKQPGPTLAGRAPMGRKGIGKLSLFSVADEVIVETACAGQATALRMRLDDIRCQVKRDAGEYTPDELPTDNVDFDNGTRITLAGLRKRQTISTANGLRQRLARRFSIIGPAHQFQVVVDDQPVTPEDRGYHHAVQYIWTYGDQSAVLDSCTNVHEREARQAFASCRGPEMQVEGWLATVHQSKQLQDDQGENLNRVAIFVRGKMAQEDLLRDFTERGVYASYLIGELHVDGLDTATGHEAEPDSDAATSSRQHIVEDDPRYVALREFVAGELKHVQSKWSELRVNEGVRSAKEIPEVKNWIEGLPKGVSTKAKRWLGKLNRLRIDDDTERRQLLKHAVIGFEFHRHNESLEQLESIGDENVEAVIRMFHDLDALESTLYGQIVQHRLSVIRHLQDRVDENAKERVIQEFIFDHLWLLDPSWERAAGSEAMEARVGTLFAEVAELADEEKNARLDIAYRKTAGQHVVIELKRPDRSVSVYDLGKQIHKYRNGLLKILRNVQTHFEPIEFVCLLGRPPIEATEPSGEAQVEETLRPINARFVTYERMLQDAFRAYSEYTTRATSVDHLSQVIRAIDDYGRD